MKKNLFTLSLTLVLMLTLLAPSFAESGTPSNISGTIDPNSNNAEVSEVMNYNEMVAELMENENMTKEEAIKTLGPETRTGRTYRTIAQSFEVTTAYKPSMKFYCETEEGYYFYAIYKILNAGMDRDYKGTSKQFGGEVYVQLKTANEIYFIVNGDFYNNGTTTAGGSLNIGIDQNNSVSFTLTNASNHFKYVYKEGSAFF